MTRKWGEHPSDGKGLERISARLKAEQLPSKEVPQSLPASMYDGELWVRAADVQLVLADRNKLREDLRRTESAHAVVLDSHGWLFREKQRLETTLRGISTCSTCEACRGAALRALGDQS